MEHRDDGLMVDFSGQSYKATNERPTGSARAVVIDEKQEREIFSLDKETRLFRAMNEIREYTPSKMNAQQRLLFNAMCEKIFAKYGITPATYPSEFGHLGTPQNLRR